MEKLIKITFKVTADNFGSPIPFIKDQTVLIIVQNGDVEFGMYHSANQSTPYPTFTHPQNADKLRALARRIIKTEKPDYLNSEISLHFVCPEKYLSEMKW